MFDHFTLPVSDLARARAFYTPVLAALGYALDFDAAGDLDGAALGYGADPDLSGVPPGQNVRFWIVAAPQDRPTATPAGQHLAFRAPSRAAVDAFHAAALAAGGTDNGAPGIRERYHPAYYAAFVLDPDGHRLEAVHHG